MKPLKNFDGLSGLKCSQSHTDAMQMIELYFWANYIRGKYKAATASQRASYVRHEFCRNWGRAISKGDFKEFENEIIDDVLFQMARPVREYYAPLIACLNRVYPRLRPEQNQRIQVSMKYIERHGREIKKNKYGVDDLLKGGYDLEYLKISNIGCRTIIKVLEMPKGRGPGYQFSIFDQF